MAAKQGNLSLPKSIIDQIEGSVSNTTKRRHGLRRNGHNESRNDMRKAARAGRKALRSRPPPQKRRRVIEQAEEETDSYSESEHELSQPAGKFIRGDIPNSKISGQPKSILKQTKKVDPIPAIDRGRSVTSPLRISSSLKHKLAEDDEEIAVLEKKLGLKGKKKLPQAFADDGLDELLEGLGEEFVDKEAGEKRQRKTKADEWLEQKRRKTRRDDSPRDRMASDAERIEDIVPIDISMEDDMANSTDEESPVSGDAFNGFDSDDKGEYENLESKQPVLKVKENPYVAPVSKTLSAKYIPPSLRKPAPVDSEDLVRLRRQTQGLVNRLTEANLVSILGDIETLYRDNPRQHVTSALVDLLLISVCEPTSLPDSLIILPAGFVAAVYKIKGTDFGAQIVQRITELFDEHYFTGQDKPATAAIGGSKETSNLIMLLSELYIFQVVGCGLIFDYVRLFLGKLSELNAELLLKVIRAAGPQLRQDDPSSLKDIMAVLRRSIEDAGGEQNISVRTKFMMETIEDLKNNRMKIHGQGSAVTSEHTIRMKKILGSLNTRVIKGSEPLRIGLDDIRNSSKKGKWWLVGASWAGNDAAKEEPPSNRSSNKKPGTAEESGTSDIFQLAKEHRMNTEIRRAIFVAIMSANDYEDAYLRLIKLKLKRIQEYEIPKVLIHCAAAEKAYNPYYTLISQKLCSGKKLRTSFQYCLWDTFKQMGEGDDNEVVDDEDNILDTRAIVNLSKLYGTLIAEGVIGLDVLKNLNMRYLQSRTKIFLEVLFITVFVQAQKCTKARKDEEAVVKIFAKAKANTGLISSMQYFLKKIVSKSDIAGSKHDTSKVKWGCKAAENVLIHLLDEDTVD